MKTIQINKHSKLNYDNILDNISAVVYVENANGSRPNLIHMAHMIDRETRTDNGGLWYKDCFGNCLISLLHTKITDTLYLINKNTLKKITTDVFKTIKILKNEAVTIIVEEV